jgi:hypothetical protein
MLSVEARLQIPMKILRAFFCLTALTVGLHVQAQTDLGTYTIVKQANYDQSSASAPTPDPISPNQFFSNLTPGTSGALFTNATLTPPSGSTGIVSYLTGPYLTSNPDNLYFAQNFTTKTALDTAFPSGTGAYDFTIQTSTPNTYTDQMTFGVDNYPPAPQIISVTNASWSGGHLVIPDYTQPVTITWNNPGGSNMYLSIGSTSYSGNTTATSFTIPGGTFSNNTFSHDYLTFTNGGGAGWGHTTTIPGSTPQIAFSTKVLFNIEVGSPALQSTTYEIEKDHFLVQTSNSAPVDGTGDFNYGRECAPYSLYVRSPVSGTVTAPGNTSFPAAFQANGGNAFQGYYEYSGGPVNSSSSLNALYPDGAYTFPDGTQVSLAGSYPSAPQILDVNGATPVWSAQGQLVLDPTKSNTITWSSVTVPNFATNGHEIAGFFSIGDSTFSAVSLSAGAGAASTTPYTTLTVPAGSMKPGNNYGCQIRYSAANLYSEPSPNIYHVAGYETQTEFYAIATYPTGLLQAISFPAIANQVYDAAQITLDATATASSGLPVTYSVVSGPATLSGANNSIVTVTGPGTVVLQASQAGNSVYAAAANVQQSFTVAQPNANYYVFKEHILQQSSNNAPVDTSYPYTSFSTNGLGPYSLYIASAQAGTVTGPGGSYPLSYNGAYYQYSSGAYVSQASLDADYPDGVYQLDSADAVNLSGDQYLAVPKITQVNGAAPVWNSAGQLVLDPTVQNTITWTPFPTTYGSFSSIGFIASRILGYQDSVQDFLNADGAFGGTAFNTHVIPANTLTMGNTYAGSVDYAVRLSLNFPTPTTDDFAEYAIENDYTIIAGSSTGVSQAINLPTIDNQAYGVAPIPLGVTTTSGLPVTYNVSGPATISGGILTITGAGTVVITVSQTGNGTYAAAPTVQQGFSVNPAALTITANNQSKIVGQTFQFTGTQYTCVGLQNSDAIDSLTLTSTGAVTSAGIASYPVTVGNATGSSFNPANYAITYVAGDMDVTAAPTPQTFGTWESINSVTTGSTGMPNHDGVPNLLKYFYDIVPGSMTTEDRAALPTLGTASIGGTPYLMLTYRQYASATGILVTPQTSSDLTNWSQATSVQTGTDPNTGDPLMSVLVPATGGRQFIRLNLAVP